MVLLAAATLVACGSVASAGVTATHSNNAGVVPTTSVTDESVTAPVATTNAPIDGFQFSPPAGDYSIVFPAEPTANEQMAQLPDGSSLPFTSYFTGTADTGFGTSSFVYPQGMVASLEAARDGALASVPATMTWSEPITLQGREGLQFTGNVGEGQATVLSRMYLGDTTLYELMVVMPGEVALDDPRVTAFFDSFRFTIDE